MLQCNHMADHSPKSKHLLCLFFVILFAVSILAPVFASNDVSAESCHTQGGTITEDHFIYTWWCGDSKKTKIYKCNRSGAKFTGCKVIVEGYFEHANVIQYNWGSKHFWLFDEGNPKAGAKKWCFTLSGKKANSSKCGPIPDNSMANSNVGKSGRMQGYALYKNYFLKGGSNYNRIFIRKNNGKKLVKTLRVYHDNEELEDVSVDGDTGEIYYTTSDSGKTRLYKVKDYKLSPIEKSSSEDKDSQSSNNTSNSSSGSGYKAPEHTESTYDGKVETTFFGDITEDGKGCGVYSVLGFIIDVLTFGIGVAAAIGITVFGVSFLTAGPDAAKATKAKRRIFEIVIGLAVYVTMYAILNFLLPGGKFSSSQECSQTTETTKTPQ